MHSQKKDTIYILLHDDIFSKSINDTLVYDNSAHSWINQNQIGKYIYLDKNVGFPNGNAVKLDTILLGKNIIKGHYKINKYIYPNNLEKEKDNIKSYLKVVDSCDNIFRLSAQKNSSNILMSKETENLGMSHRYKCYHSNFKSNKVYFTPYIFWRDDSNSDSIKIIGKRNTATSKGDIKTDSRLYKTLAELKDICKRKSKNVKCFNYSQSTSPNLGFFYLEKLDLYDYIIYINEDFVPENFSSETSEKNRKIMLNEYHFNRLYHKSRDSW